MRFALIVGIWLSLALTSACQKPEASEAKEDSPSEPDKSTGNNANSSAESPDVKFNVDGEKLPAIKLGGETVVLSLEALPPIEEWKRLIVRNIDGREFRAIKTALLTGESTMKIVKQPDQSYEFRVMQGAGDAEIVRHSLPNIKVLEIHTLSYTPPRVAKGIRAIKIKIEGTTRSLDPKALETIPRTPEPGSKKERDTWLILDLLGVKSLAKEQSIILRQSAGRELVLTASDLADSNAVHMIKRNRRGQFNYRGWTLGDPPTKTSELRGVKEIELRYPPG